MRRAGSGEKGTERTKVLMNREEYSARRKEQRTGAKIITSSDYARAPPCYSQLRRTRGNKDSPFLDTKS